MNAKFKALEDSNRYPTDLCMEGTDQLKFEYVRKEDQVKKLKEFAATFDHSISCWKFPYTMIKYGAKRELVGYAQTVSVPIVFPALNPEKVSPRIVTEIMKAFVGRAKLDLGSQQEGLVAVPLDTKTFLPHIMKRMGFVDLNHKLYAVAGD